MRPSRFALRRFLPSLSLGAGLLAAGLIGAAPPEDQKPDAAASAEAVSDTAELPADAIDLTDKVEVTVNGTLRSSGRTAHSVSLTVKNISEDDLQGPIIVLVDSTGIEALELTKTDGKLSDDRPYVEIVEKGKDFKAGRVLRSEKLNFKTAEALKPAARTTFDLKVRVCRLDPSLASKDKEEKSDKIAGKSYSQKDMDKVAAVQDKWTVRLIKNSNREVYGTAMAENDKGDLVVKVYTQRSGTDDLVPDTLDGVPVVIQPVGEMFEAGPSSTDLVYANGKPVKAVRGKQDDIATAPGDGAADSLIDPIYAPTLYFNRPVPIGTSISNLDVLDPLTFAGCGSGTLGCRVVDALGTTYLLTNLHVGGARNVSPTVGNSYMTGKVGDRIVQPSTGDMVDLCTVDAANVIGTVSDFEDIVFWDFTSDPVMNTIDACLVKASAANVGVLPPSPGYTTILRKPSHPYIGMPIQKSGRTTSYTQGTVTAVNFRAIVSYSGGVGYFINQFECSTPLPSLAALGAPGDSGSLFVTRQSRWADEGQPVGLLFAGGPRGLIDIVIANPIVSVLNRFQVQVDDGQGGPYTTGGNDQSGISGTSGSAIPDSPEYPQD